MITPRNWSVKQGGVFKPSISIVRSGPSINLTPEPEPTQKDPLDVKGKQLENALKIKQLQQKEEGSGATIDAVYSNINDLKTLLKDLPYTGEIAPNIPDIGRVRGKIESVMAEIKPDYNKKLKTYNNVREGFAGLMARTFGGEKGVMTDKDIKRFVSFLPNYETTPDERDEQWAVVDRMYQNISKALKLKTQDPTVKVKIDTTPTVKVESSKPKAPNKDPLGVL